MLGLVGPVDLVVVAVVLAELVGVVDFEWSAAAAAGPGRIRSAVTGLGRSGRVPALKTEVGHRAEPGVEMLALAVQETSKGRSNLSIQGSP